MQRAKTPTVIQMEEIESGAACLCMILGYYGCFIPLEQLRIVCGVTRDGSLSANILRAAKQYNLECEEKKYTFEELANLKKPLIVNWNIHHYVVVEKIGRRAAFINDPATGPRKVALPLFKKSYSGKAMTFSPKESFKKQGEKPSFLKMISWRIAHCGDAFLYLILAGVLLLVPGIALPTLTRFFVDEILVKRLTSTAYVFIIGLLFSIFSAGLLTAFQGYYLNRLNSKLSIRLSSHFLWHILRLPVEFYVQRYGGEIAYRLSVNDSTIGILTGEIGKGFINLLLVIVYGALLFFYDPFVATLGVIAGSINLLALFIIYRVRTDANIRLQQDVGKRSGVSIGALQNIETIKATGAESEFFSRWAGYFTKNMLSVQQIGKLDILLTIIPPFTQFLATASVLTFGGLRVIKGDMTLGMLLGLQTLMQTFLAPINYFVFLGQRIQNVIGGLNRVDSVLANPIDPQLSVYVPKEARGKLKGKLELKNVTFGYNPLAPPLIENFSLSIHPGESVALVGPSGSGKTTIARLIAGLYQVWEGEILFDGKAFRELSRDELCRSLGVIDQQIFLFGGTIRENLTLWDETIPEEDMIAAATDAGIHSVINQREKSYESTVLEGGLNFSGGQRQLLEIARVLTLNPTMLILDEATSALDAEKEDLILKRIRQRGCSVLMIAHRLSTIRDCDQIVILENGKMVHKGTHDELKKSSPQYRELMAAEGSIDAD